ncbi:hypothetical protein IWQ62_003687 [Dispira parvispora]|uniref:Uncharacterized protein n=1 Tax=Dispira parvispora TaxID=1520584 RepID=A0A9W8AME9_9FUNG|nr:hypothetical protein IWQ62_003687 [Dispira parvispora]
MLRLILTFKTYYPLLLCVQEEKQERIKAKDDAAQAKRDAKRSKLDKIKEEIRAKGKQRSKHRNTQSSEQNDTKTPKRRVTFSV